MLKTTDRVKLKTATISTLVTLLLSLLKFIGAMITGSSAILADSLHSLTDSISSMFVAAGIFLSTRKSRKFPYGLYKIENLVSLGVALLVILAGLEIIWKAIGKTPEIQDIGIGLLITGLSALVSVSLGIYKIRISRTTNSPSLKADGYHSISDALSSVVVFVGILLYPIAPYAENIAGIIVALILIVAGMGIMKQSFLVLLDAQLNEEDVEKIIRLLKAYRGISINFIRGRSSGSHYFIELGITIGQRSLKKAHELTEEIEKKVKEVIPEVEDVVIHYEPLQKGFTTYAIPMVADNATLHIGKCEYFLVYEESEKGYNCFKIENPGRKLSSGRGAKAIKTLFDEDVDVLLLPQQTEEGMIGIMEEFFNISIQPEKIKEIIDICTASAK